MPTDMDTNFAIPANFSSFKVPINVQRLENLALLITTVFLPFKFF